MLSAIVIPVFFFATMKKQSAKLRLRAKTAH